MSHEMRTPLNAVIGLSGLTLESCSLDEEAIENLEKIYNAGTTLLSTVNDILDISKIEAGKFELIPVDYDISSLINDTTTQNILRIDEKPIEFVLSIDENLPARLCGDELRIKQIFNNLLSNAFKYTKEGTVEFGMRCERNGDDVWMTAWVKDTGIGIKAENLIKLFTNYYQLETRSNRHIEGTGLGLSITKRLAEMMDGTVSVDSEYGKGSTFTVKIRQKFVTDTTIGSKIANNLKKFHFSNSKRVINAQLSRILMPYANVLVVDDNASNLDVAKGMMKPYGMHIDCVKSGEEAINAIRAEKKRYNAIFMDHMMPEMDGVEATRIIREEIGTEYAKNIPIIALTANAIVGNEKYFLSNNFNAFLTKPIDIPRLDEILRYWVRDKELEHELNINDEELTERRGESDRRTIMSRRSEFDRRTADKEIAGLNIENGIKQMGGDEDSYLEILHSYVANTRIILDSMKDVSKDKLDDYAIAIHGVKGSSRGICANMVGNSAEILEKAAKSGDFNFVSAHHPVFLEAAWKLLADIENMLDKLGADKPKPKKNNIDREVLSKLISGCKNYDVDEIDSAMEEIESYEYESENPLAIWLRENVDRVNYEQIEKKLEALIDDTEV
jgi:CheY-like chemotaxis protein/anti-sigma regulatory factor (Ser/Thr protein kinase)